MLSPETVVRFALTLIRFTTFLVVTPIFSLRSVPAVTTIGLASAAAILIMPPLEMSGVSQSFPVLALLVLHEVAVGLILGFLVILAFSIVQFAGQLTDVPIGFGMATVLDPSTGTQMPVFSQFYFLVTVLVFFGLDGHLWLLQALAQSYKTIPFAGLIDLEVTYEAVMAMAREIFAIGMKLALPVISAILLVDIGLGIVVRAVPQINVFVIGFPIKILVGMMIILAALPAFVAIVSQVFSYNGILMTYLRALLLAGGN
ncbi:MAG: flagellar biosynthetic protein FliR [Firmicutes bacterium]|nr:flagellar biosynthetic protein FliR [Bacillota bacterium]